MMSDRLGAVNPVPTRLRYYHTHTVCFTGPFLFWIPYRFATLLLVLCHIVEATVFKKLKLHRLNGIRMKLGRIVLEVNMQWLIELDISYEIKVTRWRPWRHFVHHPLVAAYAPASASCPLAYQASAISVPDAEYIRTCWSYAMWEGWSTQNCGNWAHYMPDAIAVASQQHQSTQGCVWTRIPKAKRFGRRVEKDSCKTRLNGDSENQPEET